MKFFLLILTIFANLQTVTAESMLPSNWDKPHFDPNRPAENGQGVALPKSKEEGGLAQLQDLVIDNIGQIIKYVLVSIALLYAFLNVLIMILNSSEEGKVKETRDNIAGIALGLMLIGLAQEFAKIFDPVYAGGEIGNLKQGENTFQIIINWFSLISGAVAILYMLISAMRMILAQGEESVIEDEKKDFKYGFVGLIVIIMSDVMINKVFYPKDIQAPDKQEVVTFAQEIFAVLNFVLEFMAIANILFIVIAGGYYLVSFGDDDSTNTAKAILKNLILGFILIVFAYTFISAVSPNLQGQVIAQ